MNIFRVISIIISVAFVVMLILSVVGKLPEILEGVTVVLGFITAALSVISTLLWWATDEERQEKTRQLNRYKKRRELDEHF